MFFYSGTTTYTSALLLFMTLIVRIFGWTVSRHLREILFFLLVVIKSGTSAVLSRMLFTSMGDSREHAEVITNEVESQHIYLSHQAGVLELIDNSDDVGAPDGHIITH